MTDRPPLDAHQKDTIRKALVALAGTLLGVKYLFGSEWTDYSKVPEFLDCSETTEGVYLINGLHMPDGAQNQFNFTVPTGNPLPGDLVFFGRGAKTTEVYHVGMVYDQESIIEARGYQPESSFETGKVILRPRSAWEKYANFLGYRAHQKLL